jgi:MFS family permease
MFSKLFSHSYEGNVPKYFIFGALYNFMLFFPIWVIFLQEQRGLSLPEVTFVDVAFWLTTALAELPTGLVADTVGRKQSLIISVLLTTVSVLLFGFVGSFPLLMLANSLWATALTFESGAGLALLYDSLREIGQEERYASVRARHQVVLMVSLAVSTILGGVLASWWNMQITFVISAGLTLFSLVFVLGLKEPPYDPDPDTGERVKFRQAIGITGQAIRTKPNLRMALLYRNILPIGVALVSITFLQPHARQIGVPIAMIGVLLFIFRLFRIVGASLSEKAYRQIGLWRLLWLAPAVVLIGFLALGLSGSWVGIILFSISGFITAVVGPHTENVVMRYAPGAVRATVLSVDMLIFRFFQTFVEPGLGVVAERQGLSFAFILIGAGTFVLTVLVMARWRKVWESPVEVALK